MRRLIVLALLVTAGYWFYSSGSQPKSYDECMLQEMRGQSDQLLATVQSVCRTRFPAPN